MEMIVFIIKCFGIFGSLITFNNNVIHIQGNRYLLLSYTNDPEIYPNHRITSSSNYRYILSPISLLYYKSFGQTDTPQVACTQRLPLHKGGFSLVQLYHKSAEETTSLCRYFVLAILRLNNREKLRIFTQVIFSCLIWWSIT